MICIQDVSEEPKVKGDLFAGRTFWIAQRCPNRPDLVKRVTYNGGKVELNDSRADYLIVDHTRDGQPPGSVSYRFILNSVEKAELENVETHQIRPSVGSRDDSSARPSRKSKRRNAFTSQDDHELYRHVKHCMQKKAAVKGNEIYKQHEKLHPRHSYQSYRDRWLKHLSHKRPAGLPVPTPSPEPHPDSASAPTPNGTLATTLASQKSSKSSPRLKKRSFGGSPPSLDEQCPDLPVLVDRFRLQDFHDLTGAGGDFEGVKTADRYDESWEAFAREHPRHTTEQWKTFWEKCVQPVYQEFGENTTKLQIYDDAFERWEKTFGADAGIWEWVNHFRQEVAPKLREQSTAQDQDTANGSPVRQQKGTNDNGDSKELGNESLAANPAHQAGRQLGILSLDGNFSSPVRNGDSRKHGREDDSDAEDCNESPPNKKIRIYHSADEDEERIHHSIEFSPTKKLASSPLGERKVIRVGSERSSSSLSELFVPNTRKSRAAAVQDAPEEKGEEEPTVQEHGEGEQDEVQEDEQDQGLQFVEERAKKVIGGLGEQQVNELLELLRTAPSAPEEYGSMTPFDAAVMYIVHVLTKADGSAGWGHFKYFFGKKLQELGIFEELLREDESDEEEEEQDDDAEEKGEKEVPNDDTTNGQPEREPTPVPESPPRKTTLQAPSPSQPNLSLDTTFEFSDFDAHIDDSAFEYPVDLVTEVEAEAYIACRLSPPYAFAEDEILIALHATCAQSTAFADQVLRWMRQNSSTKGKGKARRGRRSSIGIGDRFLPVMAGVWTSEDDKAVLGQADAEEEQRIERKHGLYRCRQRKAFLLSFL